MDKSLFDLITDAIITNSPKDVKIEERTLATELIESEKKGAPFSLYDFLPRTYSGKNLVLTHHLIYIFRCIVLFFIAIIYALFDLLHKIFTGKWKSRPLTQKEHENRDPDGIWAKKLHTEKWRGIQSSTGLNAILLIVTLIMAIIALVWGLHFLTKEVVLSDNNCRVNHYGIVTFDQGCLEEQHFFLLNSATFWAPTGIALSKGDKVYITASGSMYSDVDDMVESAISNTQPLYLRSRFYKEYNKMGEDAEYCIYGRYPQDTVDKENKPAYGSLLYQICDEVRKPKSFNSIEDPYVVRQINFAKFKNPIYKDNRHHFKAHKSGMLYFSFNDVLLDSAMIKIIVKHKDSSPQLYDNLRKMKPEYIKSIDTITSPIQCQAIKDSIISKMLSDSLDSLIWFDDNFGEALVNIRVEKNIWNSQLPFHKKLLVALYRRMDALYTKTEKGFPLDFLQSGLLIVILLILLWFGMDAFISERLKKEKTA